MGKYYKIGLEVIMSLEGQSIKLIEEGVFRVKIDDQTIEEMIKVGHYDHIESEVISIITSKQYFPVTKREIGEKEIYLVHFDLSEPPLGHRISTEKVLRELDKKGFRPAELPELLALGVQYPDLQRKFDIIALGTICSIPTGLGFNFRYGFSLWSNYDEQRFSVTNLSNDWISSDYFAAASKI